MYLTRYVQSHTCMSLLASLLFINGGSGRSRDLDPPSLTNQDKFSNYPPSHMSLAFRSEKNLRCSVLGHLHSDHVPQFVKLCVKRSTAGRSETQTLKDRDQYCLQRLYQPQQPPDEPVRAQSCRRTFRAHMFDANEKTSALDSLRQGDTPLA